ncbi:ankyrin, partial [Choiromyces venosus 120613-1]
MQEQSCSQKQLSDEKSHITYGLPKAYLQLLSAASLSPTGWSSMPLLALPNELLLEISTSPALEIPDIATLLRANHFLKDLLVQPLRSEIFKRRCDKYARKALYHAAEYRDKSEVKALLDDGILDIMQDGRTVLNSAVKTLSEDGVTTLLICGVDPNTVDERGRTPLICATAGRHLSAIRALLGCTSVDVNRPWIYGDFAALHLAVWNMDVDVLRLLLTCPRIAVNQVSTDEQAETDPAEWEREQRLLRTLRDDIRDGECIPIRGGWAPLHRTVNLDDSTLLRILLEDERTDINVQGLAGETALRIAISSGNIRAVGILLTQPKIQAQGDSGSILHYPILSGNRSMVQFLLGFKKIDVNFGNETGKTALHFAALFGMTDIITMLLGCKEIEVGALDSEEKS